LTSICKVLLEEIDATCVHEVEIVTVPVRAINVPIDQKKSIAEKCGWAAKF
jgi:hypothetical protein